MLIFWVVAGALAAAAAGLILYRAAGAGEAATADPAPVLYRRQLSEIDDLAERGLMAEGERRSAHAEAARRLLAAADAPASPWTAEPAARRWVLIAVVVAAALALGLYLRLGSPGSPDQPYARRLEGWQKAPLERLTAPEVSAVLRKVLEKRPDDPEGFRMLALAETASQDFPSAARALRRAVQLAPNRTDLWSALGEVQVFAAGGKVDAEAERAFREALKRDPKDLTARFYLAKSAVDAGRGAEAAAGYRAVLADLPPGDERRGAVEAALAQAEGRTVPRADAGQMAMIRGMVEGLAARLKQNPDDADGWVRLVRAYAVLGETAERDAAYAAARARYAADPKMLGELDTAARAEPMR